MTNASIDALGIDYDVDSIQFENLIGYELKLILNDDYYQRNGELFTVNGSTSNLIDMYNSDEAITLNIVGVIRAQEESKMSTLPAGIAYSDELSTFFIEDAQQSEIVLAQQESEINVLTGQLLSQDIAGSGTAGMSSAGMPAMDPGMASALAASMGNLTKDDILASLGATEIPTSVSLYPIDIGSKEAITAYLDEWNTDLETEDKVVYTDLAAIVTNISGSIMDGITMVLIAFAAISLVVSLIMIAIITYISVMERTKEIGVLRALGARKKDITRVFNAETFIIGTCSGILGIGITYLLTFPVNAILYNLTELSNVAQLNPIHALTLGVISVVLTMIGGLIPAKMAAKKDPVTALRSE
ncbi:Macrolide export ATP-binding/permease protein MacB [compost metagenome]